MWLLRSNTDSPSLDSAGVIHPYLLRLVRDWPALEDLVDDVPAYNPQWLSQRQLGEDLGGFLAHVAPQGSHPSRGDRVEALACLP